MMRFSSVVVFWFQFSATCRNTIRFLSRIRFESCFWDEQIDRHVGEVIAVKILPKKVPHLVGIVLVEDRQQLQVKEQIQGE